MRGSGTDRIHLLFREADTKVLRLASLRRLASFDLPHKSQRTPLGFASQG